MKLSDFTLEKLVPIICRDNSCMPYLSGPRLVYFFNGHGFNEVYTQGFPSRWKFILEKLHDANGNDVLIEIIEAAMDTRRFVDNTYSCDEAGKTINQIIKFDKYELNLVRESYRLVSGETKLVQPDTAVSFDDHFFREQIEKCERKIEQDDNNGAITNARSLVEAIFIEIIESHQGKEAKNDDDLNNLWKQLMTILRMEINNVKMPDTIIQILSGIDSTLKGLAGLSNNAKDRHAHKFKTRRHNAKLAVNVALTISDFMLDSWNYQNTKKEVKQERCNWLKLLTMGTFDFYAGNY